MVFLPHHRRIGSIILLLYMYLAEIGRKINSKTICRIKNLFVTTYIHARVCVFLLLYIFSLSLCTRTEASRKSSFLYRESETRQEREKKNKWQKNRGGPGQQQQSLSLRPGTNVLFSLSPLFFRTINYLRDQWRKISRMAGGGRRYSHCQGRSKGTILDVDCITRTYYTRTHTHMHTPHTHDTCTENRRCLLSRVLRAGGKGLDTVLQGGGCAGQSTDSDGSPRTFFF